MLFYISKKLNSKFFDKKLIIKQDMIRIPSLLNKNVCILIVCLLGISSKGQVNTIPVWNQSIPGAIKASTLLGNIDA